MTVPLNFKDRPRQSEKCGVLSPHENFGLICQITSLDASKYLQQWYPGFQLFVGYPEEWLYLGGEKNYPKTFDRWFFLWSFYGVGA